MSEKCEHPAPGPFVVVCNREANHEGPHRGDVADDEVIFWSWGRPRRPLAHLKRDTEYPDKWLMLPR